MAKKVIGIVRLQVPAGKANPAPPIGPALGAQGVNIMAFCKQFNAATEKQAGLEIPVVITVYADHKVTREQIMEIVKTKAADLNATDPEHAARMIEGTARSMGIVVQR